VTGAADSIWPYRLPSLAGAILAVLLTAWGGQRLFDRRTGFIGAAILAGTLLLAVEARLATTDAALLAAICLAQGSLAIAYLRGRAGGAVPLAAALLFWLALGIGILLKGPIVLLVSGTTVAMLAIFDRSRDWLRGLRPAVGLPLAAVVTLPWLVAITWLSEGAFWQGSVGTDLLAKVVSAQESHGAPPGYYMAMLPATFWPFSLLLVLALPWVWRNRKTPAVLFCLSWIIPTWLVFEAIPTKLPHYVLPTFPAIALLTAAALANLPERAARGGRLLFAIAAPAWLLWAAVLCTAAVAAPWLVDAPLDPVTAVLAAAALLLAGGGVYLLHQRRQVRCVAAFCGAAALLYGVVFAYALPRAEPLWLSEQIAAAVRAETRCEGMQLAAAGYHEPSLVFLAGRNTMLVDGAAAAQLLMSEPCSLALITEQEAPLFFAALGAVQAQSVAVVSGVNYSNGRPLRLTLYRLEPAQPTTAAVPLGRS
jgi:4-amino-4-deoxy-L-arabinose transferase-like glycosyltransferase